VLARAGSEGREPPFPPLSSPLNIGERRAKINEGEAGRKRCNCALYRFLPSSLRPPTSGQCISPRREREREQCCQNTKGREGEEEYSRREECFHKLFVLTRQLLFFLFLSKMCKRSFFLLPIHCGQGWREAFSLFSSLSLTANPIAPIARISSPFLSLPSLAAKWRKGTAPGGSGGPG